MEKPLAGKGTVSSEIYDPVAAANQRQSSGRRLSQLRSERARSNDGTSFDLTDYFEFEL